MPRAAWTLPILAVLALGVASCFDDVGNCPTCPGENSASIEVFVTKDGLVDSVQVRVDGGAQRTLKRNQRTAFEGLSKGFHKVETTRWFTDVTTLPVSRSATLQLELDRGESRTIVFHNDFPLVAWALPGGPQVLRGA